MDGLALPLADLPVHLIHEHQLQRLVHDNGGLELRFLRRVPNAILPVWVSGQLQIVSWGCRCGTLPKTGYTWLRTVEAGEWVGGTEVHIPARAGITNGVWFRIREGIKGILAEKNGATAVYVIVEPSSYYFKIMTHSERMPVLIGERI